MRLAAAAPPGGLKPSFYAHLDFLEPEGTVGTSHFSLSNMPSSYLPTSRLILDDVTAQLISVICSAENLIVTEINMYNEKGAYYT